MNCKMILGCLALAAGASAQAAGPVKIGFIATLSTPAGYIGEDERDAFNRPSSRAAASWAACRSSW